MESGACGLGQGQSACPSGSAGLWSNHLATEVTDRGRSMGAQWNDGRRFEGRVAVVTGGGGTLGGAVARGFGSEGASVAIGYRSSRSQAAEVVAELEGRGGQAQ